MCLLNTGVHYGRVILIDFMVYVLFKPGDWLLKMVIVDSHIQNSNLTSLNA